MIDTDKFKSLTQNGIWPITGEGYQSYCEWKDGLIELLEYFNHKYRFSSSLNTNTTEYKDILTYTSAEPEMSLQTLTHDMTHNGCSWTHLTLCHRISGHRNSSEDAGKFNRQLAMWLLYFDSLGDG